MKFKNITLLEQMIESFLRALKTTPVENKLWIVEVDRIRIHGEDV